VSATSDVDSAQQALARDLGEVHHYDSRSWPKPSRRPARTMTDRTLSRGRRFHWVTTLTTLVFVPVGLAACSTTHSLPGGGAQGAPSLPTPLATSVRTSYGTWATIAMGNLDQPANTFWQLLFRPAGTASWSDQVEATATATNGGLVLASAGGRSLIVGVRPAEDLTFSPLISTDDAARSWSNGLLTDGLAARLDALATANNGHALALVDVRDGTQVLRSAGDISTWRVLATDRALASGPGRSCGLGSLTAISYFANHAVIGGSCSRPGIVGIFSQRGTSWPLVGPALPGSFEHGRVEVLALGSALGVGTALIAVTSGSKTSLLAAWSKSGRRWTTSLPLSLAAGQQVASFGPANGSGLFVLLRGTSGKEGLAVSNGASHWRYLPVPPAGTVTVAFGARSPVVALVVTSETVVTTWSLNASSARWRKTQSIHVSVQFGSSS
jgi:hypothetical protein